MASSDDVTSQSQPAPDSELAFAVRPRNIEELTKLLAGLAIGCYVFGLLIVNVYLFRLGVSEFSLFRTRFILTGVAALVPIVCSLASTVLFRYVVSLGFPRLVSLQTVAGYLFRLSLIVAPVASLFLFALILSDGSHGVWETLWTFNGLVLTWGTGILLVGFIYGVISNRTLLNLTPPQALVFTGFRRIRKPQSTVSDATFDEPAFAESLIQQQWENLRATSAKQAYLSMLTIFQLLLIFALLVGYLYGFA